VWVFDQHGACAIRAHCHVASCSVLRRIFRHSAICYTIYCVRCYHDVTRNFVVQRASCARGASARAAAATAGTGSTPLASPSSTSGSSAGWTRIARPGPPHLPATTRTGAAAPPPAPRRRPRRRPPRRRPPPPPPPPLPPTRIFLIASKIDGIIDHASSFTVLSWSLFVYCSGAGSRMINVKSSMINVRAIGERALRWVLQAVTKPAHVARQPFIGPGSARTREWMGYPLHLNFVNESVYSLDPPWAGKGNGMI
jgi:hypothetical protein